MWETDWSRLKRMAVRTAVWLVAALAAAAPANSARLLDLLGEQATAVPQVARYDDWTLSCLKREADSPACQMQPAQAAGEQSSISLVVVRRAQKDPGATGIEAGPGTMVLIMSAPLQVLLPAGIDISIDGRKLGRLAFQTCSASGCVAPVPVTGTLESGLQSGKAIQAVARLSDGTTLTSSYSLKGLFSGLAALAAEPR